MRNCRTATCQTHRLPVTGIRHAFAAVILGGMPRDEIQLAVNQASVSMLPIEAGTTFLDDQAPAVMAASFRRANLFPPRS